MSGRTFWRATLAAAILVAPAAETFAQNRITGVVKDETGEGIRGATVRAQLEDGRSRVFTSATDERGRFFVLATLSGTWVLTIEAPGFASQTLGVPIRLTGRAANFEVEAQGNVLAAVAFLEGLAVGELLQEELDHHDPDYELLLSVRAVKPEAGL